ncbi:thiamine-phosphate kinase [Desulfotalea psychrophila]|uniref:Thiamine-monophosphate kinase n=1 Tax=Desulfotalea psychrophila (strain LSv54 / DSM 12343) TaxID=177439 RepID=Q6AKX6_DESPS|nr:thiamine-phosphate kinase [Desulfotalea psychrophila]CAG36999.1 related to thiamine-monophosphate kinase (ThiL) [Desulfotalea psychrophila LSv54]
MRELDIIGKIQQHLTAYNEKVICGIGDDCAVFSGDNGRPWLITTDTLVEGHHFDLSWHPAYELGCKAMAVNISDIAAMGGLPVHATISLTFTKDTEEAWLDEFIRGLAYMHHRYNINLIGGDTVAGERLSITVTLLGQAHKEPVYRHGAMPGDIIYVGGPLGSAAAGLFLFQNHRDEIETLKDEYASLLRHHLAPMPQVELGRALADSDYIGAMQDISDGLATDLAHIAKKSAVQAVVFEDKIPVLPEFTRLCKRYQLTATELALGGGDDYLLLFTVRAGREKEVERLARSVQAMAYPIGLITEGSGVMLKGPTGNLTDISFRGFEHE